MHPLIKIELCYCTRCSMDGAMELENDIHFLQNACDADGEPRFNIEIEHVSRSDLHKEGHKSPLLFINGKMYEKADSATIMDVIVKLNQGIES